MRACLIEPNEEIGQSKGQEFGYPAILDGLPVDASSYSKKSEGILDRKPVAATVSVTPGLEAGVDAQTTDAQIR